MSTILSSIAAIFVTLPPLGYIIVFIVSKQITKHHRRSVKVALDVSTFLFIISVHFLIITIWGRSFLWIIILWLLFIAAIFVIIHWRIKEEIHMPLVLKGFWRFNLLLFFTVYILLIIIGMVQRVSFFVSMS